MATAIYAKNQPPSAAEQAKEIFESGTGIYRTQKLASDFLSFVAEIARISGRSLEKLQEASNVLNVGALGVIIPTAVSSTIELMQTTSDLAKKQFACTRQEGLDFVQKISVSGQMLAYSAQLFTQRHGFGVLGDICSMVDDTADVLQAGDQLCELSSAQEKTLPKAARVYLDESRKLHCIKLAKAVFAVAVGIFGLLSLLPEIALLPAVVLLGMSVASSALALIARIYQTNMTFILKPI
jgi:hypothetical protein